MATLPLDSAQARAASEAVELQSQKRNLETLRQKLGAGPDADTKLKQACEGFETIFLNKLWSEMRKNVPKEGYLHSKEEDAYLSMFDQELMKKMSSAGGIGLGKMLYENLSDHLAKASAGTAARLGGKTEVGPLHPEAAGVPLRPGTEATALEPGDRRDAEAGNGMNLAPADIAKISQETFAPSASAAPAAVEAASTAPGVILPPGFRGPAPVEPQGPEDQAALDQALDLAGRVERGRASQRAARAYRDAVLNEAAVSAPAQPAVSYVTPPEAAAWDEEPGT